MATKEQRLETIHESLVNGNRKQMVDQIKDYGLYDFWGDYREYLLELYTSDHSRYAYFADATISYFRITNR